MCFDQPLRNTLNSAENFLLQSKFSALEIFADSIAARLTVNLSGNAPLWQLSNFQRCLAKAQMSRFVDAETVAKTLAIESHIDYLATSVGEIFTQMKTALANTPIAELAAP